MFKKAGEIISLDGPVRDRRADAEADRAHVALAIEPVARAARPAAASSIIKSLRDSGTTLPARVSGSATQPAGFDRAVLANMKRNELRTLATATPGVVRNKRNAKGKWIPKTCTELTTDLLASTQALPGRAGTKKRHAAA